MNPASRIASRLIGTIALCTALAGCRQDDQPGPLSQGWSAQDRAGWYQGTQGSRLMPWTWFHALKRAGTTEPFTETAFLTTFGFLENPVAEKGALPLGFAKDRQADARLGLSALRWYRGQPGGDSDSEPWVGLNCSACHTASLEHDGKALIVDGGPNLLDFQSFVEALDAALNETRADPDKWDRFASAVLEGRDTPDNRAMLDRAFARLLAWQAQTARMNHTPLRYGFGRLDAVGNILNKVLMFNGAPADAGNPANAPVSYPFLWGMHLQQRVQWNGIARNSRLRTPGDPIDYGALGRNTGEVLGVFGDLVVTPAGGAHDRFRGYASSIRPTNLDRMEKLLARLESPRWPDHFPPVDAGLAQTGEALFADRCARCHLPPKAAAEAADAGKPVERMEAFITTPATERTDIWMACNAFVYRGPAGPMTGAVTADGKRIEAEEPVANMLAAAVLGSLLGQKADLVKMGFANFLSVREPPRLDRARDPFDPRGVERDVCLTTPDVPVLAYKARPLDGIWATAPYLHNGSVASLYQLLLPADQRMASFWVGNRAFDPVDVGYRTNDPGDGRGFLLQTVDGRGKPIEGNSNRGHEYGARSLTEAQRRALVEYLKSL